jgi:hypothetical protein
MDRIRKYIPNAKNVETACDFTHPWNVIFDTKVRGKLLILVNSYVDDGDYFYF